MGFVGYLFFMKRTLRQLDPSGIIPTRVKSALDALTQGVVMIDTRDLIVLANDAFCQAVGKTGDVVDRIRSRHPGVEVGCAIRHGVGASLDRGDHGQAAPRRHAPSPEAS